MIPLQDILPAGDAFREGVLLMDGSLPAAAASQGWLDCPVNAALATVAALLLLLQLGEFYSLLPSLAGCLIRWRGNIQVEHSIHQRGQRNLMAASALLAFCLLANRFAVFNPRFVAELSREWQAAAVAGAASAYLLLRALLHAPLRPAKMDRESWKASEHALFNYFLLMMAVLLPLVGILLVAGCGEGVVRVVTLCICSVAFLLLLVRKWQILGSSCTILGTFLYLCGLELIPAAALIAAALAL